MELNFKRIEKNNTIYFAFGTCLCCGKTYGISISKLSSFNIFQYLCFGDRKIEPCKYYTSNMLESLCNHSDCRLLSIKNIDIQNENIAKFMYAKILTHLTVEKKVGFIIYSNKVIQKVWDMIEKNTDIYIFNDEFKINEFSYCLFLRMN